MKSILTLILLVTAFVATAQTTFNYQSDFKRILAKTKDSTDELAYNKLLGRFVTNDTTLTNFEVLALMIGFTAKPEYKPYADLDTERLVYKLNGDKQYQEALNLANNFLKTHPLSVKTLYEKAYAFYKRNQPDSVAFFKYQGMRIFKAMYFSGKGINREMPTFALGPADGQDYIHKFLRADIGIMGSGKDKAGNFLDMLEVKMGGDKSFQLYFIIQHAVEKMFVE